MEEKFDLFTNLGLRFFCTAILNTLRKNQNQTKN